MVLGVPHRLRRYAEAHRLAVEQPAQQGTHPSRVGRRVPVHSRNDPVDRALTPSGGPAVGRGASTAAAWAHWDLTTYTVNGNPMKNSLLLAALSPAFAGSVFAQTPAAVTTPGSTAAPARAAATAAAPTADLPTAPTQVPPIVIDVPQSRRNHPDASIFDEGTRGENRSDGTGRCRRTAGVSVARLADT